jgi:NAD(P)-dependent dehydrogenase (short-subunit alcohol dehydrogenase family)
MNLIQDKVAVVTGGTRGIGVAIARGLLEKGAQVLICSRNSEEVAAVVRELRAVFGARAWGTDCDVSDYRSVQALFSEADRLFAGLDILINNAGIGSFSRVADMTVEEWSATLDTNLSGVFYCCREALPLLKKRGGGFIINLGSLAGKHPRAGAAAYCASKFGLIGFTESLMEEVRYDHVRVSCVMPGSVNTGFAARGEQDPETTWKLLPEDVAAVVVDLLEMDARALPSRVELRPSEPGKQ